MSYYDQPETIIACPSCGDDADLDGQDISCQCGYRFQFEEVG